MKTLLTLTSLVIVGSTSVAEIAHDSGVSLPAWLNTGNAFIAFTVVLLALVLTADYGRRPRSLLASARPVSAPSARVRRSRTPLRGGYTIRRGPEAARLAPPARVVVFPANPPSRGKRAA